jgi:hypothetical protein
VENLSLEIQKFLQKNLNKTVTTNDLAKHFNVSLDEIHEACKLPLPSEMDRVNKKIEKQLLKSYRGIKKGTKVLFKKDYHFYQPEDFVQAVAKITGKKSKIFSVSKITSSPPLIVFVLKDPTKTLEHIVIMGYKSFKEHCEVIKEK